ncbi:MULTISPECIES: DUF4153 domain-containing protein [Chryseobacterium]|uniref:DUF4153 domain-containing protein n=1 Tax=Chryseobacterium geocarposphaerae TaxID=1416776 RepID=A0ABU1LFZ6_9FLAO|nr:MULTISPECIES: DUF4153 domain-containing protein [Chryseobacterium]MDR6405624.1 hypothetical protein [Chryseobacterium geocarposphaerae]MDR6698855.1 hypothetical protein [Chryseobacterium ginsenosidimutans]
MKKLKETLSRANEVIFQYPIVLVMALLASVGAICMFENDNDKDLFFVYSKFTICACLGISLMFALKMLSQRIGKTLLLQLLGIIFLIGFYFILPEKQKDFTEVYGFIIAITALLSHLLVSFVAFLEKNKELGFWQYNKNLFVNIFLTAVFTGVLTGGVELAILAVDKLFDFNFNDNLYVDTLYVLAIFGSCFIFLLFNEKGLYTLEKDGTYPIILKFFTQFILIPLLLIYVVILYFYSFKILINWELPRGWVSYLILAYSIVGILALLLVYPLKEEHAKSWVKIFSKAFYFTIVPLIILLFVAIFTRILEYGYTEPRYFVLLLALWLLSIIIYFIFNKKATIKFIPVSLFIFGLFALIFPYLNAFSVAKRSQKNELLKALNDHKLLDNGKINFNKKITDTISIEIADKFEFLARRKQGEFLLNLLNKQDQVKLTETIKKGNFYSVRYDIQDKFSDVHKTSKTRPDEVQRIMIVPEKQSIAIGDYQYLLNFSRYDDEPKTLNSDEFKIVDQLTEKSSLKLLLNSKDEVDFGPQILKLFKENKEKRGTVKVPELSMETDLGMYHVKLIFKDIMSEKQPYNNRMNIYYTDAYLLIKLK